MTEEISLSVCLRLWFYLGIRACKILKGQGNLFTVQNNPFVVGPPSNCNMG